MDEKYLNKNTIYNTAIFDFFFLNMIFFINPWDHLAMTITNN